MPRIIFLRPLVHLLNSVHGFIIGWTTYLNFFIIIIVTKCQQFWILFLCCWTLGLYNHWRRGILIASRIIARCIYSIYNENFITRGISAVPDNVCAYHTRMMTISNDTLRLSCQYKQVDGLNWWALDESEQLDLHVPFISFKKKTHSCYYFFSSFFPSFQKNPPVCLNENQIHSGGIWNMRLSISSSKEIPN